MTTFTERKQGFQKRLITILYMLRDDFLDNINVFSTVSALLLREAHSRWNRTECTSILTTVYQWKIFRLKQSNETIFVLRPLYHLIQTQVATNADVKNTLSRSTQRKPGNIGLAHQKYASSDVEVTYV